MSSLSSKTGIIECLIRHSCNHPVDSNCIATWLHDNNTCLMCRREFFPTQPQAHLGHGFIINRHGDDAGAMGPEHPVLYQLGAMIEKGLSAARTQSCGTSALDINRQAFIQTRERSCPCSPSHIRSNRPGAAMGLT